MVALSLDPPPSSRNGRSPRAGLRRLGLLVVLLAGLSAGFAAGRYTAPGGRFPLASSREKGAPAAAATPSAAPAAPGVVPAAATAPAAPVPVSATPAAPAARAPAPAALSGPRRIATRLSGALEESIRAAMPAQDRPFSDQLTQVVNRLLVWDLQVSRDGRRGDQIELVYLPPGTLPPGAPGANEPVVEAIRFASQKLGRTVAVYRFQAQGSRWPHYYRVDGSELEERLVTVPVADYDQVTSLLRDGRRHKGVDFRTPVGTPVFATFDGVIERRNWNFAGNGNCLDVKDPATGRHAIYLHLEVLPKDMVPSRRVKKGEQIALSGNSGHSFAAHLHYQMEDSKGTILDPFAVQPTHRVALDAGQRPAFDTRRTALDAQLSGTVVASGAPVPAATAPAAPMAVAAPAR
ncbi:M23 family metallopeptidase [Anaeromyxobacter oryzisoli]|uniref:M23 family metallopeptidase n=1 Tax=Anaeromyxobacter oryzisoli TaxID=2925408 RepID=UPI001F597B11|nr:M23 family metallopeptidase [Anaeromyxobacter sp. SG63]